MNKGLCTNLPSRCSKAASKEMLARPTPDTRCPECGSPMMAAATGGGPKAGVLAGVAVAVLAVIGVALWLLFGRGGAGDTTARAPAPGPAATASAAPALRLAGSNTVGAELGPALVEAFARKEGYGAVERQSRGKEELLIVGRSPGKPDLVFEVSAHGTGTGFKAMAAGQADIAMASRAISRQEAEDLKSLGDLTSSASEIVIALDGLAVIVNPANPVQSLTLAQLRDIYTGRISDWSKVGRGSGPIKRYARNEVSGTFDTFQALVLGKEAMAADAARFEDSRELSDAVAADPAGIGFIGLPYIRNAKALAIADGAALAMRPTRFTVAAEDYALSRRLFLYLSPKAPPLARRFVEFAAGNDGQKVADQAGFVGQVPERVTERGPVDASAPAEYLRLTRNAEKLSNTLRFRFGSSELDSKAERDVARLVGLLEGRGGTKGTLMLFGFADNVGSPDANVALSLKRAQSVAQALGTYGVKPNIVYGFGQALPVADNASEAGRERNRRVEVWLSDQSIAPPAAQARTIAN